MTMLLSRSVLPSRAAQNKCLIEPSEHVLLQAAMTLIAFGIKHQLLSIQYTVHSSRIYKDLTCFRQWYYSVTGQFISNLKKFTVLATDLQQSHGHSNHTWSLLSTVSFLSCYYFAAASSEDSTQFNSSAPELMSRQADVSKLDSIICCYCQSSQSQSHIATDGQSVSK
jgi:hypothetical protein